MAGLNYLPAFGLQHRGVYITPQALTHSLVLLKMGKIISRNMLSWLDLRLMEILTSVKRQYISFKSLVNDFVYSFGRASLLLLVEVWNHTVPVRERVRIRDIKDSGWKEKTNSAHNYIEAKRREANSKPRWNSRVPLDSLHDYNNHAFLVEKVRKKLTSMMRAKCKIKFSWVKERVGIFSNIMADRRAKGVAWNDETSYEYSKTPTRALNREVAEETLIKWQSKRTKTSKAKATKQYFPTVQDRIVTKIHLTTKLTAVLTSHGKTKAYLHRFNLRDDAKCICNEGDQTLDHILFQCTDTTKQRDLLKFQLEARRTWPASKLELITKHKKVFTEYIESIDFDQLQQKSDSSLYSAMGDFCFDVTRVFLHGATMPSLA